MSATRPAAAILFDWGETLVSILRLDHAASETSAHSRPDLIAEDLGVIPDFVRESMKRLGLPGMKVLRWERQWKLPDRPLIDPREFPALSVATTGTHDIVPLAATEDGETAEQQDAVLRSLLESGSNFTLMPVQDVFGWTARVNTPAVVDDVNWTWRLPWPVDEWLDRSDTVTRARMLHEWTRNAGR